MNTQPLQPLLHDSRIWRAGRGPSPGAGVLPAGHPDLERMLPGGGWPLGALTEILHDHPGAGEMQILLPALASLEARNGWIALIAPPYIPYAPALTEAGIDLSRVLLIHPRADKDTLWSMEQTLRNGNCSAVLAWPGSIRSSDLRRLQLAAEAGDGWCVLFHEGGSVQTPSPATLRLRVRPHEQGLEVAVLKARGAPPGQAVIRRTRTGDPLAEPERPGPGSAFRGSRPGAPRTSVDPPGRGTPSGSTERASPEQISLPL